jgi:hypothetical protein
MFRRLKVLCREIKSNGVLYASKWLITTAYRRIIPQKQVIWCVELTDVRNEEFVLPGDIKIERFKSLEQVNKNDLKILTESHSDLMGSASGILIRERFNKGAMLWLIKKNDQLAGYRWTIANNHKTPTYFPHTETDMHSIGIEIFRDFRRHHLFYIFQQSMVITLKNEGFKRFYSETFLYNKRAMKAMLNYGLRKIGIATRFSIFGKNIVIWHDMSEKITFK